MCERETNQPVCTCCGAIYAGEDIEKFNGGYVSCSRFLCGDCYQDELYCGDVYKIRE